MQVYRQRPSTVEQLIISVASADERTRLIAFCSKILEHDAQSPCAIEFDPEERNFAKVLIHHLQELSQCGKVWALGPCPSPKNHEGECLTKGGA